MLAPAVEIHRLSLRSAAGDQSSVKPCIAVAVGRCRMKHEMNGVRVAVHQSSRRSDRRKLVSITASPSRGGGVGDRAHMDDSVELAALEPVASGRRAAQNRQAAAWQIPPLAVAAEDVADDDDIGAPGVVEAARQYSTR